MSPVTPLEDPAAQSELEQRLLARRADFPILQNSTYLISHSLGAMPKGVHDSLGEYARMWETRGIRSWAEGWWDMPITTGDLLAPILGVEEGSIAMHQNVSVAVGLILSCFDWSGPRNKVVYTDMNFPSVMYVNEAWRGAEVVTVPSDDGITVDLGRLLEAIDERTLLVPVSHVLFRSGYIQDAAAIIAIDSAVTPWTQSRSMRGYPRRRTSRMFRKLPISAAPEMPAKK